MTQSQFVTKYVISYSTDRLKWIFYKGDSRDLSKVRNDTLVQTALRRRFPSDELFICLFLPLYQVFTGNQEAYETKKNTFFPPMIGRFIRLHPINWNNKATVRMEFYGCELDGEMLFHICEPSNYYALIIALPKMLNAPCK